MTPRRSRILILLLIVVPLGFYSKFYTGPAAHWVNHSVSGVWYELFWCLVGLFFLPEGKAWLIALVVLLATSALECLQLWHPPFLQYLRSSFLGRTVLGTSFAWSDFPYYVLGCGIGWLWMRGLQRDRPHRQPMGSS